MIVWKQQGEAILGAVSFVDGRHGNVVIVGPRSNTKGAILSFPAEQGEPGKAVVLSGGLALLHPRDTVDVICMQERCVSEARLPAAENIQQ